MGSSILCVKKQWAALCVGAPCHRPQSCAVVAAMAVAMVVVVVVVMVVVVVVVAVAVELRWKC